MYQKVLCLHLCLACLLITACRSWLWPFKKSPNNVGTKYGMRECENSYESDALITPISFKMNQLGDHFEDFDTEIKPSILLITKKSRIKYPWKRLKKSLGCGWKHFFDNHLAINLQNVTRIAIIVHGFFTDCTKDSGHDFWVDHMAANIISVEPGNVAVFAICWDSNRMSRRKRGAMMGASRTRRGSMCDLADPDKALRTLGDGWASPVVHLVGPLLEKVIRAADYHGQAKNTVKIGEFIAGLVTAIKEGSSQPVFFHGIGHSLGAHALGNVWTMGRVKLDRISGLDPAGPCFDGTQGDFLERFSLTKHAAEFVDVIHTDGGWVGTVKKMGHVDFYPGQKGSCSSPGGVVQPCSVWCGRDICNHLVVTQYFLESIVQRGRHMSCHLTQFGGVKGAVPEVKYSGAQGVDMWVEEEEEECNEMGYFARKTTKETNIFVPMEGRKGKFFKDVFRDYLLTVKSHVNII